MEESCKIDEELLLAYALGDISEAMRVEIEASPVCLAKAKEFAAELITLKQLFYRRTCPSSEDLVAYQERRLSGVQQLLIRQHLQTCPLCQEEYSILVIADTEALVPEARSWFATAQSTGRKVLRIVEAMFQPALEQGIMGDSGDYTVLDPPLDINVRRYQVPGNRGLWSVLGQVQIREQPLETKSIKTVILRGREDLTGYEYHTTLDEDDFFLFEGLKSGSYYLQVLIDVDEPVILEIPTLSVGIVA